MRDRSTQLRHLSLLFKFLLILPFLWGCCCISSTQITATRAVKAEEDKESLDENIELPNHCLTLDDIIEIALRHNLDLAVKAQEYAIQRERVTRATLLMLPQLNANLDWSYRNNSPASVSRVLRERESFFSSSQFISSSSSGSSSFPPLPITAPQVGAEKRTYFWNFGVVWDLIDFGLAYFQSQQECDQLIIAAMEYERVRQSLILTAVNLYWRAMISRRALEIAAPLIEELKRQTQILEKLLDEQYYFSKDQLYPKLIRFYQRDFQLRGFNDRTDSSDPTQGYAKEYENAMFNLAALMGMPPNIHFELCRLQDLPTKIDVTSIRSLEEVALLNRPELYRFDAEEDIAVESIYAAILQEFPGMQLFYDYNHDDNRFLVHKNWWSIGLRSLWNLFSIPVHYTEGVIGSEREELARRNRLVESIAILTQVNLGNVLYEQNLEQYLLAKRIADNYAQFVAVYKVEQTVGKIGAADVLQAEIDAALARINSLKIYAELQRSIEQLNNAIGLPRYFQPKD